MPLRQAQGKLTRQPAGRRRYGREAASLGGRLPALRFFPVTFPSCLLTFSSMQSRFALGASLRWAKSHAL
jgi:hypothetical protein